MNMPFMKFYVRDWISDPELRMVSLAARGLWIECLCYMHQAKRRGYLETPNGNPISVECLSRLSGTFEHTLKGAMDELLEHGIPGVCPDTGIWYSRRMVKESHKSELCSQAGKRGGNPTLKSEESEIRDQIPDTTKSLKGNIKKTLKGANEYSADFLTFWDSYPRKVNKGKAYQAWCKRNGALPKVEVIVAAVRAQCGTTDWKKEGGQFIPHPSSWLNAAGWENDIASMNQRKPPRRDNL